MGFDPAARGMASIAKSTVFQKNATFFSPGPSKQTTIANVVKRIDLYNADPQKQYALSTLARNNNNGWTVAVDEVQGQTKIKTVCLITNTSYPESTTGIPDMHTMVEQNSSGITGKAWVDWSQMPPSTSWWDMRYNEAGLSPACYVGVSAGDQVYMALPPYIPAVVGHEINVYFDNIIQCNNLNNYQIDVTCTLGIQQAERWTAVPTTAGDYSLTIQVFKDGFSQVATGTTTVRVAAASAGAGVTKGILQIGDSMTANGTLIGEIVNLFSNDGKEVDSLTITAAATASGNVTVTLNGVATNVAVTSGDTTAQVATKIAAASYTGWTASASGSIVTFTSTTVGTRTAPSYSAGTTGATGTMTAVIPGSSAAMSVTMLGTLGTNPNKNEGRGGWKISNYLNDATYLGWTNAFLFGGVFDFVQYCSTNSISPDIVCIELGTNDMQSDPTTALNNLATMISKIRLWSSTVPIHIYLTIPPAKTQDGWGKQNQNGNTRNWFKQSQSAWVRGVINTYKNRESEKFYIIPVHVNLDTVNNFVTESVAANSRNSTLITRQTDNVHPAASGYYQMADTVYYWLKNFGTT